MYKTGSCPTYCPNIEGHQTAMTRQEKTCRVYTAHQVSDPMFYREAVFEAIRLGEKAVSWGVDGKTTLPRGGNGSEL